MYRVIHSTNYKINNNRIIMATRKYIILKNFNVSLTLIGSQVRACLLFATLFCSRLRSLQFIPNEFRGKARECRSESDCAGIQNTTCLADQRDGKTRCLCGDYNAPVNGACNNKYKAIRASCNDDNECIEGAHCTVKGNNTTSGKRCYCREGYVENNLMCNGCSSIFSLSWMIFLVTTLLLGRINYL
ncbi:low-density lipoprotein receptor 1-like isoform X2 [Vespa mandarinia]|uniref:low-density lipoprotein receptor 1-like isoform X2 n=1 Tax=Vespa mandarinia TaxID=7446 RepID=UPI00160C1105|nr:low-density lipoprotein receptor 1-like isoform X2 [Vespa mandarinia]